MSDLRLYFTVARKSIFRHLCIRFFSASFRLICKSLGFRYLSVYQEKERLHLKTSEPAFMGAQENVCFIISD